MIFFRKLLEIKSLLRLKSRKPITAACVIEIEIYHKTQIFSSKEKRLFKFILYLTIKIIGIRAINMVAGRSTARTENFKYMLQFELRSSIW